MAVAWRAGTSGAFAALNHLQIVQLTIPVSVAAGDQLLAVAHVFTFDANQGDTTVSGVGPWVSLGAGLYDSGDASAGGVHTTSRLWSRVATGADAGSLVNFGIAGTIGTVGTVGTGTPGTGTAVWLFAYTIGPD